MSTTYPQTRKASDSHSRSDTPINVNENERLVSAIAGVALALLGLKRGSVGGLGVAAVGGMLAYRAATGHCPLYTKLGFTSAKPAEPSKYFDHGIHVEVAVSIDREPSELYGFWRKLENLPRIMDHLERVEVLDEKRSRWTARGPAGASVTWDAEIINDIPDQTIAWRSLAGAQVDNAGSVRFVPAPTGRGTEVHVVLEYIPPARVLGKWIARLFGQDPQLQIETDLRNFKQLMETGEVATTRNQPRGQCECENE